MSPLPGGKPSTDYWPAYQAMCDFLGSINDKLNTLMATAQNKSLERVVMEYDYNASASSLTLGSQSKDWERITSIIAVLPANATGLLQLGDITIPLSPGITLLSPVDIVLNTSDLRSLSSTLAGPISLVLTGRTMPTYGVI